MKQERKLYTLSGEGDSIFYISVNDINNKVVYFSNINREEEGDAGWKNKECAKEINPDYLETYTVTRIKPNCWEKHIK
jgi:hypothetical protein